MKKLLVIIPIIILIALTFTGCDEGQMEVYNTKDKSDFNNSMALSSVKFDIVQFKTVLDERTLKESKINGGFFIFMGGVSGYSKEEKVKSTYYYTYLKNKNGAIYFAKIPVEKVRIYQDAEKPCIVGFQSSTSNIDVNSENIWEDYDIFNLHIPEGTIIPRIDLSNINFVK